MKYFSLNTNPLTYLYKMNRALATVAYNIFTKCELNGMHSFVTINPVYSHKHAVFRHHKKPPETDSWYQKT